MAKNCWMSGKLCRPWPDTTFCGIWPGSKLFAKACLSQYLGLLWHIVLFWGFFFILFNDRKIDSICHSSLPRMVLEKVTLTTIQFRIHPCTKVDPMFQCVYISTPLKSCPYKSSATCAWFMARVAEKTHLNIYVRTTKVQISLRVFAGWSAPLLFAVALFFRRSVSHT